MAVLQQGGTRVVGLALHADPPAPVRPDGGGNGNGSLQVDQAATLLDVKLDEGPDPAQRLSVPADMLDRMAGSGHRLGHRHAVRVTQRPCRAGVQLAGDQAGPGARDAEPCALLVDEADHADRP